MSDHLPECPALDLEQPAYPVMRDNCYCDRLRACEQRVAKEYRNREMNGLAWTDGYDHGAQAAREAVQNLTAGEQVALYRDYALAAIDALTEGK